tara:strand:- start:33650 stop:33775 length:126 start_codon:yes stop_codon:yes gene_type:complete
MDNTRKNNREEARCEFLWWRVMPIRIEYSIGKTGKYNACFD